ncbi:UNVERIFIED_CONTAM: Reticulocyte-binding protein 2-like protein a [Trichonephila clavipes]
MLISYSDDSRVSAVIGSDMDNTLSQSVTESELKIEESSVTSPSNSQSVSIADKNSTKEIVQNDNVAENIPSEAQQKEVKSEVSDQMQTSFSENLPKEAVPSKPRITSEEEARAALAEKRRLAREQAEREAELERQRLEEIRQEEEQKQLEELEQKRMEEEQIRLAALHRQMEEEKLAKAIEEQQQREKEELERKEEEVRQKAEKEEQERKAREEAEKQRFELEEKLRKEEEERAERKRRVEQIMARTRGKTAAQSPSNPPSDSNNFKNVENTSVNSSSFVNEVSKMNIISNGVKDLTIEKNTSLNGTSENHVSNSSSWPFSESKQVSNNNPLPDILNSENIANQSAKSNGTFIVSDEQSSKINVSNSFSVMSNRTLSANEDTSPQTNGYSSHEEMSCTTR